MGLLNTLQSYFSPSDFDPGPNQQQHNSSSSAAYGPVTHPEFCRFVN